MKVLLIEDDPETIEAVRLCFEICRPDMTLVSARKGLEGIKLFQSQTPDVVMVDLGLDDMDGLEVIREIRRSSKVPILVVSARSEPTVVPRVTALGANDFVVKPFHYQDLLARLDNAMK